MMNNMENMIRNLQDKESYTIAFYDFTCDIELENNEYDIYIHALTINKSYYESVEIAFENVEDVILFVEENLSTYKELTGNE